MVTLILVWWSLIIFTCNAVIPALVGVTCDDTTTENYDSTSRDICWVKVASCIVEGGDTTWTDTQSAISALLPHAISVRFIPTSSYNEYAVVAKPCSNPVWAINNEYEVSFVLNTNTGLTMDFQDGNTGDWIGSSNARGRLDNQGWETPSQGENPRSFFQTMYQATNGAGIHLAASNPTTFCAWIYGEETTPDIEVYIGFETDLSSDCYTTLNPTSNPTTTPTTATPTKYPTKYPTKFPTKYPTKFPTKYPSKYPTKFPSKYPTKYPSKYPSKYPTKYPTNNPTNAPSLAPTQPPSLTPSVAPTESNQPTISPSQNTNNPTPAPTTNPTLSPSISPSTAPSISPTLTPSIAPSIAPTPAPTDNPSATPTPCPTTDPTPSPTSNPTITPVTTNYSVSVEINNCHNQQQQNELNNEILSALNNTNVVITNTECDDDTVVVKLSIKTPPGHILEKNVIKGAIEAEIENDDRFGEIEVEEIDDSNDQSEDQDALKQLMADQTIFLIAIIIVVLICCLFIICGLFCVYYYGKQKAQRKMLKIQSVQLSKMQSMSSVTDNTPIETNEIDETKEGNEQEVNTTEPDGNSDGLLTKVHPPIPNAMATLGSNAQIIGDTSNLILNADDLPDSEHEHDGNNEAEEEEYEYYEYEDENDQGNGSDSNEMMYNSNNKHRTTGGPQVKSIEHGVLVTPGDH